MAKFGCTISEPSGLRRVTIIASTRMYTSVKSDFWPEEGGGGVLKEEKKKKIWNISDEFLYQIGKGSLAIDLLY